MNCVIKESRILPLVIAFILGLTCIQLPIKAVNYKEIDFDRLRLYNSGCIKGISAVQYKNKIYVFASEVSTQGWEDAIRVQDFTVDENGVITKGKGHKNFTVEYMNQVSNYRNVITSCIYNEKPYVFFIKNK